jgi:cell division protein FtsQ
MKAPGIIRTRVIPAIAATIVVAALGWMAWYGYGLVLSRPIARVAFTGELERVARSDLEAFARTLRPDASLAEVRVAAKRIPWVRDAAVRREFPDGIEVTVLAHEPLARWGDAALVSTRGDVFVAKLTDKLPRLRGPDGSAPQMAREFPIVVRTAQPLASPVAELRLSARGAWQVLLESGLVLDLGRGDIEPRLARFAAAWPRIAAEGIATAHADLRYANGFAIRTAQVRK